MRPPIVPVVLALVANGVIPGRCLHAQTPSRGTATIKLFFVALEDNGKSGKKIGCNDSLVGVTRTIPARVASLSAALAELVSSRDRYYGQSGLYNALSQSTLTLVGVRLVNERAEIDLSGTVSLAGACDRPRFEAQIKETALQFPTVKTVVVHINGAPLETILSGK